MICPLISLLNAFSLSTVVFRGIWNVPHITSSYLIRSERLSEIKKAYSYETRLDADMSFTKYCRDKVCFLSLALFDFVLSVFIIRAISCSLIIWNFSVT